MNDNMPMSGYNPNQFYQSCIAPVYGSMPPAGTLPVMQYNCTNNYYNITYPAPASSNQNNSEQQGISASKARFYHNGRTKETYIDCDKLKVGLVLVGFIVGGAVVGLSIKKELEMLRKDHDASARRFM